MNNQFAENEHWDSQFARSILDSGWESASPELAEFAWYDGELVTSALAPASIKDHASRIGGVIAEFRCFSTPRGPAVFRLSEHIEMFLSDIKLLGIENFWFTADELRDIVCRVVQINHLTECFMQLGLIPDENRPVLYVTAWESFPAANREALENGIRLIVASINRDLHKADKRGEASPQTRITRPGAAGEGKYEEAISIDSEGFVTENGGENLLAVRNNTIYAPPLARILESLARDSVLALARDAGFTVAEERLSQDQLFGSDEIFVLGPAAELLPVREIDHQPVGRGGTGPVTRKLQKLLADTIKGRNRRSSEWLDYMILEPVI